MNQCLRTEELVARICDEVDKRSALSMALAHKAFLEPALDRRWRDITSFEPLVACLPEDLLELEELEGGIGDEVEHEMERETYSRMMRLRRKVCASDLERYLDYYAHRIRSFRPHPEQGKTWLSIEALQAIQLATDGKPGVLSPLLRAIQMTPPGRRTSWYLEKGFASRLAPCMALFFGPSVTRLEFSSFDDDHLYCSAIENLTNSNPDLLSIVIRVHRFEYPSMGKGFTQEHLASLPWLHLKELTMVEANQRFYLSSATIQHLSTLPLLSTLNLDGPSPSYVSEDCHIPPRDGSFPSLQRVSLGGVHIPNLLRALPATNMVRSVECYSIDAKDERSVFSSISTHCNPFALKELEIRGYRSSERKEALEPLDEVLDIGPLLQFQLESVDIRVASPIQITPAQVERFGTQWHFATRINIYSLGTTTRSPFINHTHVLAIAKGCPSLVHLGLRFDASWIGRDTKVQHFGYVHPLHTLYIDDSPIYSPAAVERFLGIAFPKLGTVGNRSALEWDIPMYKKRWSAVADRYAEILRAS